jgi:thiol:disulfide interchange protein DsbC
MVDVRMKKLLIAAVISASFAVSAQDVSKSQISAAIQQNTPFKVKDIEESPINDLYQVITETGVIYASKDGKHLFSGAIHMLEPGLQNLTQARNLQIFKHDIDALYSDFITYRAPDQKHEVIVFYDDTCGYCQKMHSEIASYNALGITVHYAAFPREGVLARDGSGRKTGGYQKLQSIWCSDNKNMAFNMSSRNANVPAKVCETTIAQQFKLGENLGVNGTPAVYSLSGLEVMRGYAKADILKNRLVEMEL